MKATIKQAETNERKLSITNTGYGQYLIECDYRGKRIKCHSTNSSAVDNFRSDSGEKLRGTNRIKLGYETLINECVRKNK